MHDFPLIATVAAGFTAAWVLGLFTQWLRLSPIVGYLLAGVIIGPHSPGFVGDLHLAHQLAEVGVILLMFGVGLHFHLGDLLAVKNVAIPGALGQSLAATLAGIAIFMAFGMEVKTGMVLGMAMAVASTVVLMRVLMDADVLNSPAGHTAVGWLLVEDVLTVVVLVIIPVLGHTDEVATGIWAHPLVTIGIALLKLAALVGIVLLAGSRVIPWTLTQVSRLRSRELFTLTVMVFSVAIAAGAYAIFGASMALGAFLAGMVVAQSPVSHQAAADALPLRDAFAVLFFVAVGMLFDPLFILQQPLMMLAAMGIILLIKPLVALLIVAFLGHSARTALTVALGLAQIGEFSFILSDVARKYGLMTDGGHNLLVAGAILSITINPLLFRSIDRIEDWLRRHPRLWKLLNSRAEKRVDHQNTSVAENLSAHGTSHAPRAIVIGFGPVGRSVDRLLRAAGLQTVIIDLNIDTILELEQRGQSAIYGDASLESIQEAAGVKDASHLLLTLPQSSHRTDIVAIARKLNPKLKIFVRARYLREQEELIQAGATAAIFEEGEAAVALSRLVLSETGAGRERIEDAVRDIRTRLLLDNVSSLRKQAVRNIMLPWSKVRRLSNASGLQDVRRLVGEQHFSRWPVVDFSTGEPLGYLLAKDLIGLDAGGPAWTTLIRPLGTISADDDIESTLQYFQQDGATIGLVRSPAGPVGIVTLEDILEQVVGRIEDEYPRQPLYSVPEILITNEKLLSLSGLTAEEAIQELVSNLPPKLVPDGARALEQALGRERELSDSRSMGVAVPHAAITGLAQPIVVFGRLREAPPSPTEGEPVPPVDLFFLLVTPSEQPDLRIHVLGQLARIIEQADTLRHLRTATSPVEVRAILQAAQA